MPCSQKDIKIPRNPKRIRARSWTTSRRSVGPSNVDGLLLGMSIATVVAQVLEGRNSDGEKMSVDYLYGICILAVRESLGNVFGDRFDNFVKNFEKSFQSTLMTLRLINGSSQHDGEQLQRASFRACPCSVTSNLWSLDTLKVSAGPCEATEGLGSLPHRNTTEQQRASFGAKTLSSHDRIEDSAFSSGDTDGLVAFAHRTSIDRQCHTAINQFSTLSTIEKSIMEQSRSNDLKTLEIGLIMKKLQLKERQLELERWKLSLKKCLDFLVAGIIIMLVSLAYATYVCNGL